MRRLTLASILSLCATLAFGLPQEKAEFDLKGKERRTARHCLLILCTSAQPASSQLSSNPKQLQQDGIAMIERWMGFVSRTGNTEGAGSDLATAYKELQASVDLFVQRNDFADAAWSAIKMGDILRYNNRWSDGLPLYQKSIEWAKRANRADYQTKALHPQRPLLPNAPGPATGCRSVCSE